MLVARVQLCMPYYILKSLAGKNQISAGARRLDSRARFLPEARHREFTLEWRFPENPARLLRAEFPAAPFQAARTGYGYPTQY